VRVIELMLHFVPLVVLGVLLLKGCYVGEARIVAARERALPRPRGRRRAPQRWRPAAERAPRSLALRSARGVRGPPAPARAAAA
jgi:hypothetical protein